MDMWVVRDWVEELLVWRGRGRGGGLEMVVVERAGLTDGLVEWLSSGGFERGWCLGKTVDMAFGDLEISEEGRY